MRLSVLRSDPGFLAWARMPGKTELKVFFEDVLVDRVLTADEERGYIVAHVLDARGRPILSIDRTELITKELHGRVRIQLPDLIAEEPLYIEVMRLGDRRQRHRLVSWNNHKDWKA